MTAPFKVACVQTRSGLDMARNLERTLVLAAKARDAGAALIALPEAVNVMESDKTRLLGKAFPQDRDPSLAAYRDFARASGAWVLVGSLILRHDENKLVNRSFLIGADGEIKAAYDKIHMFDVNLGGAENHRESAAYRPGSKAVLADTPWGRLGMTVCYDLRFPHLYRVLAQKGAKFLSVPAAFTRITGRAHWHVLVRARAIETGCYVFAPAQCGEHAGGRETFGHSLIIDPWGEVLAEGGEEPGFILAALDPDGVDEARRKIPSLEHDRDFD